MEYFKFFVAYCVRLSELFPRPLAEIIHAYAYPNVSYMARKGIATVTEREILKVLPTPLLEDVQEEIVERNDLSLVQFLHDLGVIFNLKSLCVAAFYGQLSIVRFVHACMQKKQLHCAQPCWSSFGGWRFTAWHKKFASEIGSFKDPAQINCFLRYEKNKCGHNPLEFAAANNHGDVAKFLFDNRKDEEEKSAIVYAAAFGHLSMVELLYNKETCPPQAFDVAAICGRLQVAKWLKEHGATCTAAALEYSASNGNLVMVQYVFAHCKQGDPHRAMHLATNNGHRAVFDWLKAHRKKLPRPK